jgi:hypothetical protein
MVGNKQDKEHKNDEEYDCPAGERTETFHSGQLPSMKFFTLLKADYLVSSRSCCATSLISFFMRNKQDEQHEDNQEHDCPAGKSTKNAIIIHSEPPPPNQT